MARVPVVNFTKGELSPELYSRVDTAQYSASAKRIRNAIIQPHGGLQGRPGTRFVGYAQPTAERTRLVPFQFGTNTSYVLAFEHLNMKVLAGGGLVVEPDDLKIHSLVPVAGGYRLGLPFHGLAVGDQVAISGLEGATQLNGAVVTVTAVPDDGHIDIAFAGAVSPLTGSSGVTRAAPPPPPPPPPATTPPPPPPPPPPTTGGGGGYNGGGGRRLGNYEVQV